MLGVLMSAVVMACAPFECEDKSNEVPVTVGVKNDIIVQITGGFLNEGDLVCVPSLDSAILSAMGRDESGQGNSAGTSLFSGILNN